jgi:hypothetical protein
MMEESGVKHHQTNKQTNQQTNKLDYFAFVFLFK